MLSANRRRHHHEAGDPLEALEMFVRLSAGLASYYTTMMIPTTDAMRLADAARAHSFL